MGGAGGEGGGRAAGSPPRPAPDPPGPSRPRERPGQALVGTRAAGSSPGLDPDLADLSWPRERLGQALEALVRRSGLHVASGGGPTPAVPPADASAEAGAWLEWAAGHLGVEA